MCAEAGEGRQEEVLRSGCDLPAPRPGGEQKGKVAPGSSKSWDHATGTPPPPALPQQLGS